MRFLKSLVQLVEGSVRSLDIDVFPSNEFDARNDVGLMEHVEASIPEDWENPGYVRYTPREYYALYSERFVDEEREARQRCYLEESISLLRELSSACNSLEVVKIRLDMEECFLDDEFCMSIVETFSVCPSLKKLFVTDANFEDAGDKDYVQDMEYAQDACHRWSLNSRIQYVHLFGTQYLPRLWED